MFGISPTTAPPDKTPTSLPQPTWFSTPTPSANNPPTSAITPPTWSIILVIPNCMCLLLLRRMSSLIPDPEPPKGGERRASSFLNRIFRKSTGNAMETLTEEPKKDEQKQQLQPNFVIDLQEKIAQIR